jgi:uncharacterized protein YeaO (DUF488 family)
VTLRPEFVVRRVYDEPAAHQAGYRVLVDRLWPRGLTKAAAALDEWLKAVAPSTELRRWYDHDVTKHARFANKYRAELSRSPASEAIDHLVDLARTQPIVLLTATRDLEHSAAVVLQEFLSSPESGPGVEKP